MIVAELRNGLMLAVESRLFELPIRPDWGVVAAEEAAEEVEDDEVEGAVKVVEFRLVIRLG